jgi:hypothetical protein
MTQTPETYIDSLPDDRKAAMDGLRKAIRKGLPKGFAEIMQHGMIGWVVPLSTYPAGYHASPGQPLPFISIASQKNFVALYHMGLYGDKPLLDWFTKAYAAQGKSKLDMGKSCVRFKKPDQIPLKLMEELAGKIDPKRWIALYEKALKR